MSHPAALFAALLLLAGCPGPPEDTGPVDADGDGFSVEVDCDDQAASVHPGAQELCNGVDDNCDGVADEGVTSWLFPDGDGDGWGQDEGAVEGCELSSGYAAQGGDCDDNDPTVHPGAEEE